MSYLDTVQSIRSVAESRRFVRREIDAVIKRWWELSRTFAVSDLRFVIHPELWRGFHDSLTVVEYVSLQPSTEMDGPDRFLGMKVIVTPHVEGWQIRHYEEVRDEVAAALGVRKP